MVLLLHCLAGVVIWLASEGLKCIARVKVYFLQPRQHNLIFDHVRVTWAHFNRVDILCEHFLKLMRKVCLNLKVDKTVAVFCITKRHLVVELAMRKILGMTLHHMSHQNFICFLLSLLLLVLKLFFFLFLLHRWQKLLYLLLCLLCQFELITLQRRSLSMWFSRWDEFIEKNPGVVSTCKNPVYVFII